MSLTYLPSVQCKVLFVTRCVTSIKLTLPWSVYMYMCIYKTSSNACARDLFCSSRLPCM